LCEPEGVTDDEAGILIGGVVRQGDGTRLRGDGGGGGGGVSEKRIYGYAEEHSNTEKLFCGRGTLIPSADGAVAEAERAIERGKSDAFLCTEGFDPVFYCGSIHRLLTTE